MYSKRMIKLVRCGYSRQLSSTCFLLFLSVLLWLFFCNDFLFSLLSSLSSHLSSFCFWPQNRPRRLVFSLFSLFVALVVFYEKLISMMRKKKPNFSLRATSSQSRRTLTRSRARLFTNTLSAYIFVVCKIRNRRSTKTHTQAKRVCLFFLFVTKE